MTQRQFIVTAMRGWTLVEARSVIAEQFMDVIEFLIQRDIWKLVKSPSLWVSGENPNSIFQNTVRYSNPHVTETIHITEEKNPVIL